MKKVVTFSENLRQSHKKIYWVVTVSLWIVAPIEMLAVTTGYKLVKRHEKKKKL